MSENNKVVSHEGIITSINGQKAEVSILVKSACGECHIKGGCSLAEIQNKIIEADLRKDHFQVNEKVLVKMKESLGLRAVLLAYILPVFLIVLILFVSINLTKNENISALLSLVFTVIYFIILYFFKDKIRKTFNFSVHKLQS